MTDTRVIVHRPDGTVLRLGVGQRLKFGRSVLADIVIRDDTLSRLAGEIHVVPSGVEIANLSGSHVIEVTAEGRFFRLPKRPPGEAAPAMVVPAGAVAVGSPRMHRQGRAITVRVDVPTALQHLFVPTAPIADDASQTRRPIDINPRTKEFTTALMLCRPWLEEASRSAPLPKASEIARTVLEAVGAAHLLGPFDNDVAARARYVSRIQDHLKALKTKVSKSGLVAPDCRVTTVLLAETLINHDVITAADLALLDDPDWLTCQENLWWTKRPPRHPRD